MLLRGFSGVEAQRCGVGAAAQRSGGTAGLGARLARFLEWRRRWIGCREGSRGEFKGRSRGSRARLGKGMPGGFAGDLGGPSRGEDDPAKRARLVSETWESAGDARAVEER